jgi:hypothetical protein
MPVQEDTVIPRASCFARGICCCFALSCGQKKQIPRSAVGLSYGKRHRGGAKDDSNLAVDFIELADLFLGNEGPPGNISDLTGIAELSTTTSVRPSERIDRDSYSRRSLASLRMRQ